jgi:hypothetical protein
VVGSFGIVASENEGRENDLVEVCNETINHFMVHSGVSTIAKHLHNVCGIAS